MGLQPFLARAESNRACSNVAISAESGNDPPLPGQQTAIMRKGARKNTRNTRTTPAMISAAKRHVHAYLSVAVLSPAPFQSASAKNERHVEKHVAALQTRMRYMSPCKNSTTQIVNSSKNKNNARMFNQLQTITESFFRSHPNNSINIAQNQSTAYLLRPHAMKVPAYRTRCIGKKRRPQGEARDGNADDRPRRCARSSPLRARFTKGSHLRLSAP
jgi:hypothetical protein